MQSEMTAYFPCIQYFHYPVYLSRHFATAVRKWKVRDQNFTHSKDGQNIIVLLITLQSEKHASSCHACHDPMKDITILNRTKKYIFALYKSSNKNHWLFCQMDWANFHSYLRPKECKSTLYHFRYIFKLHKGSTNPILICQSGTQAYQ